MKDRDLVRLYWPVELRPAFDALFEIDDAMGDVVMRATQPALAAIKLAWWRERLEELDQDKVPAEPRLAAAAQELLPRGVSGRDLAELEEGWARLLQPDDDSPAFIRSMALRAPCLFGLLARILDVEWSEQFHDWAASYVTVDMARRGIFDMPGQQLRWSSPISKRYRPLSTLGALARRDMRSGGPPFESEGTPARAWALLKHRLTGRL